MTCGGLSIKNGLCILVVFLVSLPRILCQTGKCRDCFQSVQNGRCLSESDGCRVLCNHGYWGENCQYGKLKLTAKNGYITDGHKNYAAISKIMWLIEAENSQNSGIHFKIEEFLTECNWDHLYIFDGGSIYSPQIAAFSGHFIAEANFSAIPQDIVARSGKAYIYFYSDVGVQNLGFNISYSIVENCNCTSNGRCNSFGLCVCDEGWTGKACEGKLLNCSECINGICNKTLGVCECTRGFTGEKCDQQTTSSHWAAMNTRLISDSLVPPQTSHSSGVVGDWMYVYRGYTAREDRINKTQLVRYHLAQQKWQEVPGSEMLPRWRHTMITYKDTLIVYGGESNNEVVDTKKLAIFNLTTSEWSYPVASGEEPVGVVGHTATIAGDKMFIIFGLSKNGMYPFIQQYDIVQSKWEIIKSNVNSSFAYPRFGHSSVFDKFSDLIYVYGGLAFLPVQQDYKLLPTDSLVAFSLTTKKWFSFASSGFKEIFHSAVILDGMMLIYGGNPYIDKDQQPKCHTSKLLSYDFACQRWTSRELPQLPQRLARYGHTAVVKESTMYIFGGFNGALFNDILTYTHGNCSMISNKTECLEKYFSAGCLWLNGHCANRRDNLTQATCPSELTGSCALRKTCEQCTSSILGCGWSSGGVCMLGGNKTCPPVKLDKCRLYYDCKSCSYAGCIWKDKCIEPSNGVPPTSVCPTPCVDRPNSSLCLDNNVNCIWCERVQRCVDDKLYVAYYPYGQCLEWTTKTSHDTDVSCGSKNTCDDCHGLPGCGWCEGPEENGLGSCLKGGDIGDMENKNCTRWYFVSCPAVGCAKRTSCDECHNLLGCGWCDGLWRSGIGSCHRVNNVGNCTRWYDTECPACQCNGHSNCASNSSVCRSCDNHTTGEKCEKCAPGHFGDSRNGGICKRCFCNRHANEPCDGGSGKCKCNMKGVSGDYCQQCAYPSYEGNATDGGYCFYKLTQSFIYKINVSDRTIFNFVCTLTKSDKDTEIKVDVINRNKTFHAKLNISVESDIEMERFVLHNYVLNSEYSNMFSKDNFDFGHDNFRFKVYIYDLTPQTTVSVSVHQPTNNSIDLLQFFIIFLACFIGLLILAIIFWKAKTSFDAFRVSRRRNVELVYMTNRPFASVPICIEKPEHLPMKTKPSPLTSEICYGNKAGVVTVLIRMPVCAQTEGSSNTEVLCLGSALVNFSEHPGSKVLSYMKNVKRRRNPFRSTRS